MGASDFVNLPNIGASIKRKEDYRFLTGGGQYTDDITLANQSYAVFVRSPHAHAKINSIDLDRRQKSAGRARYFCRRRCRCRQDQRPAVRLADHQHRRHAR